MVVVLAMALGFAALRAAFDTPMGMTLFATHAILGIAVVGAICQRGAERAYWLGFAICGWIYIRGTHDWNAEWPSIPTQRLLEALGRVMGLPDLTGAPPHLPPRGDRFRSGRHCLWGLLFAGFGGLLARLLFGTAAAQSNEISPGSPALDETPIGRWWLEPLIVFVSGLVIVVTIAIAGARLSPGLWGGLTFFMTCLLLGLAAVGGLFGSGKRRGAFLGAAVFGAGFLLLAFARPAEDPWPLLPTFQLLEDVYPRLPIVAPGLSRGSPTTAAANARVRRALQKPVSVRFNDETPLEDVLSAIQESLGGPDGERIPIYVNPLGLAESGATMSSAIRIDEQGRAPLRAYLRRVLDQLDLTYIVKDGVLEITSRDGYEHHRLSTDEDAYQVAGHCVLAMIAAGLGGLAAPFVCRTARKRAA